MRQAVLEKTTPHLVVVFRNLSDAFEMPDEICEFERASDGAIELLVVQIQLVTEFISTIKRPFAVRNGRREY
ncbi:MAG TPA: hypothetical protein VFE33_02825 [Thermoanaerobaculia bacterium]|nr:hypothetical protein [Thermoanaerobaculia bacterium]